MSIRHTRRSFLETLLGGLLGGVLAELPYARGAFAKAAPDLLALPEPFDFDQLRTRAQQLARQPFLPSISHHARQIETIDFDLVRQIRFRPERALTWPRGAFPVQLFHVNRYAPLPVDISIVQGGSARRVLYSPAYFDYGKSGLGARLAADLGFSGFRVTSSAEMKDDWLAFQGASYFRSAGPLNQYGLSARGIAVDTTAPGRKEEFPRFVAFWLAEAPDEPHVTIYALLDGPSLAGAYRFECGRGADFVMDVHAELFQRAAIAQLGIAPLTSMYWYSETNHRQAPDWRPEVHDSDGLAMWTGSGERIWRPLNNPARPQTSSFLSDNPKGFGLLQRDRNFEHYLDDGVYYDRRPSAWVEPSQGWGRGAVVLVELPTSTEIEDNVVAFWRPERPASAGTQWTLEYRLHWAAKEPFPPSVARVVATRLGRAGQPGAPESKRQQGRKFDIEFSGGPLIDMPQRFDVSAVVTASRGTVASPRVLKILGTDLWRAEFDLETTGDEPVDLRCFLRLGDATLSETWLYQYLPRTGG